VTASNLGQKTGYAVILTGFYWFPVYHPGNPEWNGETSAKFDIFTAVLLNTQVFWKTMLC
jgi:hypothetical protein